MHAKAVAVAKKYTLFHVITTFFKYCRATFASGANRFYWKALGMAVMIILVSFGFSSTYLIDIKTDTSSDYDDD